MSTICYTSICSNCSPFEETADVPIQGVSAVRLVCVEGHTLGVADVAVVEGTLLLWSKLYAPAFDVREVTRIEVAENFDRLRDVRTGHRCR